MRAIASNVLMVLFGIVFFTGVIVYEIAFFLGFWSGMLRMLGF